jgi:diguanylate cyclase (GGDEF)-like protein
MSGSAKINRPNPDQGAQPKRSARGDLLALAIAVTATCMVAATGGEALSQVWYKFSGIGLGPNQLLTNALLLNIALVIFGWRRYEDVHAEVVARRNAEDLARQMEQTDTLTGCLNRHSFAPRADQLLAALRERGETAALVMLDIHDFKHINDKIGSDGGDRLLADTARRIEALLPPDALLARLGGDEFACVIPYIAGHPERVTHIAEAMIATMDRKLENHRLSASVGMANGDRQNRMGNAPIDANGLLHLAEVALLHAKKLDRPVPVWFEDRWKPSCVIVAKWKSRSATPSRLANSCPIMKSRSIWPRAKCWALKCWRAGIRRRLDWSDRMCSSRLPKKSASLANCPNR